MGRAIPFSLWFGTQVTHGATINSILKPPEQCSKCRLPVV